MNNTDFVERIHNKNKLRHMLKQKKHSYAKLCNVPEAAEECIELKADIDAIERKLNNL
jgi:hypothetical protein